MSGISNLLVTQISPRPSSYINLISPYQCLKYLNFQKSWDKIFNKNLPINCFSSQKMGYQMFLLRNKCKDHCLCLQHYLQDPRSSNITWSKKALCISSSLDLMILFDLPGRASYRFYAIYLKIKLYVADLLICTFSPPSQSFWKYLFLLTVAFGKAFDINMHLKSSRQRLM